MKTMIKALVAKKTLFAVVLALTIFGAVYGFAATLNIGTGTLSAGNAAVASCQVATPVGTYGVAYDSTLPGYKVSNVTVTGIDAACVGKTVSVSLTGASNLIIGGGALTGTAIAGGTLVLPVATSTSAALVTGVSVAING